MSASDVRRVTVHAGDTVADLTLPATIAVAELIPPIVEMVGNPGLPLTRLRLSSPGCAPLPDSTTLAQNGIRDGAIVLLSPEDPPPPRRYCADEAETVAAALRAADPLPRGIRTAAAVAAAGFAVGGAVLLARGASAERSYPDPAALIAAAAAAGALVTAAFRHRHFGDPTAGLTLAVVATTFAAAAGLLAVPGAPGAPGALLASMTAAATAVLAFRVTRCGRVVLTALACAAMCCGLGAFAVVLTGAPSRVFGPLIALAGLGLIQATPRTALLLARLAPAPAPAAPVGAPDVPQLKTDDEVAAAALRADQWVTGLRAAFTATVVIGVAVAVAATPRAIPLAVVTGGALLLFSRTDSRRAVTFTCGAAGCTAIGFAAAAAAPGHGPWIAACAAILTTAAMLLGFVAPSISLSPPAQRVLDAVGYLALTAVVPLAGWTCELFAVARGLNLSA
ncbi:type VII secretion integral membrane protein EccD [Mycobacterium sp.]|uniref:type VII secretion integral membrane protein EccD n=1 Tax=Mycobacterium sp. TaxID=1785 RepID=UPI003A89DBAB